MWTEEDRDLAIALLLIERERCTGCGHPAEDSTAAANEYGYTVTLTRCHACAEVERATRKFAADNSDGDGATRPGALAGLFTTVALDARP